ncbi:MAG: FAD-dependent monooxygenase [Pseudomonadota bacterium]
MSRQALIAGGGIGALAAALACARAGWQTRVYEQAPVFSEVGAGIQLGPNSTRVLQAWGLGNALESVASFPERLVVKDALDGRELGRLRLGQRCLERYGSPYATVHRADLHGLLLEACAASGAVDLRLDARVRAFTETDTAVQLEWPDGKCVEGDALIGADGLWSQVRAKLLGDGPARLTGHLAYRALQVQADLPESQRSQQVSVWLGPMLHVVRYPVRGGALLNTVVFVHGAPRGDVEDWDQSALAVDLQSALAGTCASLREMVESVGQWRLWTLNDRSPVTSPGQMALGRVALLGDAAHPMRPYMAQGAGMAIEDAAELARCLGTVERGTVDVPLALRRYALNRWERSARVQRRAQRNGEVFHATGLMRWGRDLSMNLLGERLLDVPWLYGMPKATRLGVSAS